MAVSLTIWPYFLIFGRINLTFGRIMDSHAKKMAVLSVLRKQTHPLQLSALLKILGPDFAERSVRRWLNELVQNGKIEKIGQKRSTRYQIIVEKIISNAPEKSFIFSTSSNSVLEKINQPLFQRNPVTYNKNWMNSYKPNKTFYLSTEQRKKLKSTGKPELNETPAGTYARKIFNRLLIELSYNSSRLEGNTYTLGKTEKLIMEGVDSIGKLDAEKIMILNHKEAIRYLVDNGARLAINFNTICTLHYLLSDGLILTSESGKIRDHTVKIGGIYLFAHRRSFKLVKTIKSYL